MNMEISGNDKVFTRPLFIVVLLIVLICFCVLMFVIYFILEDESHKKYPFKLRWIWFLIWFGIRTNDLSSEAHRIYNEYKEKENNKIE